MAGQPIGMQLVLSVGSVHADVMIRADRPPQIPGLTTCEHAELMPGGKAANVAVIARTLGGRSLLWGCVGDDELGTVARRGPQQHGVERRRRAGLNEFATGNLRAIHQARRTA